MGARDFSVGERVMEMAMQEDIFSARSWLFAPGDSEKKMEMEREEDGQHVGLLVKNLENVQGDERDIIIKIGRAHV